MRPGLAGGVADPAKPPGPGRVTAKHENSGKKSFLIFQDWVIAPGIQAAARIIDRRLPSIFQGLPDHPPQTVRQPFQNGFLDLVLVKQDTLTTDPVPGAVLLGAGAIGIDPVSDRAFDGFIWVHHSPRFFIPSGDGCGG
jgi:hypothetical protein